MISVTGHQITLDNTRSEGKKVGGDRVRGSFPEISLGIVACCVLTGGLVRATICLAFEVRGHDPRMSFPSMAHQCPVCGAAQSPRALSWTW